MERIDFDFTDKWPGPRPSDEAMFNAREFLTAAVMARFRPDRIKPSIVGGIGVTYRNSTRRVYLEFANNGRRHVLFSDLIGEPEVKEITIPSSEYLTLIAELKDYLSDTFQESRDA